MNQVEEATTKETRKAMEEHIRQYLPVVSKIAYRVSRTFPTDLESDELVSAGMVGLADAASRYDPTQAASFATFATRRVRGAIIDEIRSAGPLSRDTAAMSEELSKTVRALQHQLGRQPDEDEIAAGLGISIARYRSLLEKLTTVTVLSPRAIEEATRAPAGFPERDLDSPEDSVVFEDLRNRLADAVSKLSEREQHLLAMVYRDDLPLREIGDALGVCESRACQIRTAAVHKLRAMLDEQGEIHG